MMEFSLALREASSYKSKSQVARVITEDWLGRNGYCPNCEASQLIQFGANRSVADFYCGSCNEEFELKSERGKNVGLKVPDGAYSTMIKRIESENNPNFFFLSHHNSYVNNLLVIPKHFFVSSMIEKRKPLGPMARRAGWVGCNISLSHIPEDGKIYFVKNSVYVPNERVREQWNKGIFLEQKKGEAKGWLLEVMRCLDKIQSETFTLNHVYAFERAMQTQFPNNNFIKDKLRQQLQILRDKGYISFLGNGKYRKLP